MRGTACSLLVAYVIAIGALLATADGLVDRAGRPLGTDFANVYAAGKLALEGNAAAAYDWPRHHDMQKAIAGRADIPYFGWHYPPAFLLLAVALAALPYLGALLVYQAATLAAYLAVVRQIAGRAEAWLPALAFPAVFVNVTHGHNGFITAALLGGALLVLDRRPLLAGVLIGCLAYKPQFGLLVPLVLAATGRWRTIAAAAATVLAIAGLTWAAFGADVFAAFWQSLAMTRRVMLEGAPGFHKIQSVYAALRLLGVPGASPMRRRCRRARRRRGAGGAVALGGGLRAEGRGAPDRPACWRRPTCSTTTSSCWRRPSPSWPCTACARALRPTRSRCWWRCGCCRSRRARSPMTAVSLTPLVLIAAFGLILRRGRPGGGQTWRTPLRLTEPAGPGSDPFRRAPLTLALSRKRGEGNTRGTGASGRGTRRAGRGAPSGRRRSTVTTSAFLKCRARPSSSGLEAQLSLP